MASICHRTMHWNPLPFTASTSEYIGLQGEWLSEEPHIHNLHNFCLIPGVYHHPVLITYNKKIWGVGLGDITTSMFNYVDGEGCGPQLYTVEPPYCGHPPLVVLISEVFLFQEDNTMYLYKVGTWSSVLINQVSLKYLS